MAGEAFAEVEKALDERTIGHNPERLSTLKGGIVYSNAVTTVSPTFATELLTGGGFVSDTLRRYEGLGYLRREVRRNFPKKNPTRVYYFVAS